MITCQIHIIPTTRSTPLHPPFITDRPRYRAVGSAYGLLMQIKFGLGTT